MPKKMISGERRKAKFSKKLLGEKIRTQMVLHRVVIKYYENGIVVKPWGNQGVGKHLCPEQEAVFLTNENVEYIRGFLDTYDKAKKIINNMDVQDG